MTSVQQGSSNREPLSSQNNFASTAKAFLNEQKKHLVSTIVIIASTLFAWRNIIISSDLPAGADLIGFPSEIALLTRSGGAFKIWMNENLGLIAHPTFVDGLALINSFVNNPILLIKIYMIAVFALGSLSMYFFTYHFVKNRFAAVFSSLLFEFNQVNIGNWTSGMLNHSTSHALVPLTFLAYTKALEKKSLHSIAFLAGALSLNFFVRLDAIVYLSPPLLFFGMFSIILPEKGTSRLKAFWQYLKITGGGFIIALGFSATSLLPIVFGVRAAYFTETVTISLDIVRGNSLPLYESFLGLSYGVSYLFWVWGIHLRHSFLTMQEYRLVLTILPSIAFTSLTFARREKIAITLTLMALATLFLAKGPYPPFGEIYVWAFDNVPLFNKFSTPNRWLRVTEFSLAFLAGAAVNGIVNRTKGTRIAVRIRMPFRNIEASIEIPRILFILHILFILLLLAMFLPVWPVLSQGFLTWNIPEYQSQPYEWLAAKPGDFRVMTVPWQVAMWTNTPGPNRIPGVSWFSQDLGFRSMLYHGRSTLGLQFFMNSEDYTEYVHGLIINRGTNEIMKLLGALGVKYLVVQGYQKTQMELEYSGDWQHRFFSNQEGLSSVYANNRSSVYENQYYIPHIYGPRSTMAIAGGREALTSLVGIEKFNLEDWYPLFVEQQDMPMLKDLFRSKIFFFANTDAVDIVMYYLENVTRIRAAEYASPTGDGSSEWVRSNYWVRMGLLNRVSLFSYGPAEVTMPIAIKTEGEYDIWMRILQGPDRATLNVFIGEQKIGSVLPWGARYGFKWIKIGSTSLEKGNYELKLVNTPGMWASDNDVYEIVVAPTEEYIRQKRDILERPEWNSMKVVYLLSATQMSKWTTVPLEERTASEGLMLTDETTQWTSGSGQGTVWLPNVTRVKGSLDQQNWKIEVGKGEYETWFVYKLFDTQDWSSYDFIEFSWYGLDSKENIRIWFGKDFDNRFEFVLREDWSGWRRVIIPFKRAIARSGYPSFSEIGLFGLQVENAPGLRFISDIKISGYLGRAKVEQVPYIAPNGVMVEELVESLKFEFVKEGSYGLSLRAMTGRGNESVSVSIDNESAYIINLNDSKEEIKFFTFGPVNLTRGNHTITIHASERAKISELYIYSLDENVTSLSNLFEINSKEKAEISYRMINPTKYAAHVKTSYPLNLVFEETYDPMWRAFVDGHEILPQQVHTCFNGFQIDRVGEYDVTIEFVGQHYVIYGVLTSLTSILLVATAAILRNRGPRPSS